MGCERYKAISDDRSIPRARARFERHLARCPECRRQVARLKLLEEEFASMARGGEQRQAPPNLATRNKLMIYATRSKNHETYALPLRSLVAAAALFALAVAAVFYLSEQVLPLSKVNQFNVAARVFTEGGEVEPRAYKGVEGETFQSPENGRLLLSLGGDTIGLNRSSRLKIRKLAEKETRLVLVRGQLACHVSKRQRGSSFVVESGGRQVIVKGTRFSVKTDKKSMTVTVTEGKVVVKGETGKSLPVKSGETLRLAQDQKPDLSIEKGENADTVQWLLGESRRWKKSCLERGDCEQNDVEEIVPAEENPEIERLEPKDTELKPKARRKTTRTAVDSLPHLRELILEGRLLEAEKGLLSYVRAKPQDVEGWWLLSTCQRKSGQWAQAVKAYRKVIQYGDSGRADKARFRAAAILQEKLGRHRQAIALFKDYIEYGSRTRPLRAEAMVRLAESLLATGQRREAARILEQTTVQYGQTPASDRARRILKRVR